MHAPPDVVQRVFLSDADEELFRGAVPQPQHWVEAWSVSQSVVSFRQAEKQGIVMNWLSGRRGVAAGRKAFAAMIRVMSLVVRLKKRARLRAASAISIGLDDRGAYRLITYRCDTPCPEDSKDWTGWASGCLGVLRRGGAASAKTLENSDDDYSKAMADSIVLAFRRVATGTDGVCDEDAATWMMQNVRIGVADGHAAAQKCLRFLACGRMPNMLVIVRDFAHAVRIATRDPLLAVGEFEAWWTDVFDSKFALIPAIQNSEEWTEKLLLCQRAVLGSRGEQGAGLKVVAKCLQFAKQRFDSVSTPMAQFCCLLVAIAMLLAATVSDHRAQAQVRERARRRLQELPSHILTAGLCSSYAEEGIRFVRVFDKSHHDPARTWKQLMEFTSRMRLLFLEGHIWSANDVAASQSDGDGGVGESGSQETGKTLLEIVLHEAKNAPTIYYDDDGRVLRLFRRATVEEQRSLQTSVHQVTQVMLDRLEVELSLDNAIVLFTALDLSRWRQAFLSGRRGDSSQLDALRRHSRRLLAVWRLDSDATMAQLEGVVAKLVQDNRAAIDDGKVEDYRAIWVQALRPNFGRSVTRVQELVRIYMAALDGTCGVERDLGALTRVLQAHSGPVDEDGQTISHCVEVLLDGPVDKTEVATRPEVGESGCAAGDVLLLPTEFARQCVRLWSDLHGRRFLIYKPNTAGTKRPLQAGTMASVIRGVASRTESILKRAREGNGADTTVLGVPRGQLIKPGRGVGVSSKKLEKFVSLTATKKQKLTVLAEARTLTRRTHRNPFSVGVLNPNQKLRRGRAFTASPKPPQLAPKIEPRNGVILVASCSSEAVPATPGYQILTPARAPSAAAALQQLMRAQIIVWDATWQLDGTVVAQHLISAIVAIGLGKAVLCRPRWRGPRPHTSSSLVQYLPAARQVKAKLALVGELGSKHTAVCSALRHVAERGTQWTIVSDAAAAEPATKLATLTEVRDFLQRSRRVYTSRRGVVTDLIRRQG